MSKVLILGGYGNFGKRISTALSKNNLSIIIAGRNRNKAEHLQNELHTLYPGCQVEIAIFDIHAQFSDQLHILKPAIVINTCGPFQTSDYSIVESCISQKVHYIDLADGRDFVNNIASFDKSAKDNNVLIISGASTVPGLSSAVLDFYKSNFSEIDSLIYGISPGQQAERGIATTQSILTYLGKPLKLIVGHQYPTYGWQDVYRQDYPELGKRWMANCDIPDLDLFPEKYQIKFIQFSAGMENTFLHLGIWITSWLVRLGLPLNLSKHSEKLLRVSKVFDYFGTPDGGMHMLIRGKNSEGKDKEIKWFIVAKNGDGPQIPCVPAIVLTKKLLAKDIKEFGAMPCVSMITLDEYLVELKNFSNRTYALISK